MRRIKRQTPYLQKLVSATVCVWILFTLIVKAEKVEEFQSCATTPTYKFFEQIQYEAYLSSPEFQTLLVRLRSKEILKQIEQKKRELDKRANPSVTRNDDDPLDFIGRSFQDLELPTCYEDPLPFRLLLVHSKRIDGALKQLGLPLNSNINFGTLPTTEVNAYTYPAGPAGSGIENVIAVNSQLFMFAYQMTRVTIPTITIKKDVSNERVVVDASPETAYREIQSNPDIKTNYSMALLEFLGLVSPSTQPLSELYDPLVISLAVGVELFVVAHEYGHVIKKHVSPTATVTLGQDDSSNRSKRTVPVLTRSWAQELEADQIGIRLIIQALKNPEDRYLANDLRWVYSLKGALFFFRCLEIVRQAKAIRDTGNIPTEPTMAERVFLRAFANGRSTPAQNQKFQYLISTDHPPPWLRLERVRAAIESEIAANPPPVSSLATASIADGTIQNAQLVWKSILPSFPLLLDVIRRSKNNQGVSLENGLKEQVRLDTSPTPASLTDDEFSAGCDVRDEQWPSTFLCSPALEEAVVSYQAGDDADQAVLQLYEEAIRQDWRLLSGVQVEWAESQLLRGTAKARANALAIIALSGDRQATTTLASVDATSWSENDRRLFERTKQFVSKYGRDTSTTRLAESDPSSFRSIDFLCFPSPVTGGSLAKLIPLSTSRQTERFLVQHSRVPLGRSISSMMLIAVYKRMPIGNLYGDLADLLLAQPGAEDAALQFAIQGLAVGGPVPSLENSIGNALTAKHEYRAANEHYDASLTAGRNDGWPELNKAKNLVELGELQEAEKWFRLAVAKRPTARSAGEYAQYLNEFAWFLATRTTSLTKLQEAMKLSEESNNLVDRNNPNYLDTLAECQARMGYVKDAVKTAEEALKLVTDSRKSQEYADRLANFRSKLLQGERDE